MDASPTTRPLHSPQARAEPEALLTDTQKTLKEALLAKVQQNVQGNLKNHQQPAPESTPLSGRKRASDSPERTDMPVAKKGRWEKAYETSQAEVRRLQSLNASLELKLMRLKQDKSPQTQEEEQVEKATENPQTTWGKSSFMELSQQKLDQQKSDLEAAHTRKLEAQKAKLVAQHAEALNQQHSALGAAQSELSSRYKKQLELKEDVIKDRDTIYRDQKTKLDRLATEFEECKKDLRSAQRELELKNGIIKDKDGIYQSQKNQLEQSKNETESWKKAYQQLVLNLKNN